MYFKWQATHSWPLHFRNDFPPAIVTTVYVIIWYPVEMHSAKEAVISVNMFILFADMQHLCYHSPFCMRIVATCLFAVFRIIHWNNLWTTRSQLGTHVRWSWNGNSSSACIPHAWNSTPETSHWQIYVHTFVLLRWRLHVLQKHAFTCSYIQLFITVLK